ncbi:MAG: COX15/CtaA family protein [Myxococcales bacterium]|nr:COX15/CtaA family protein [Myxococcales bacterium]
MNRSSSAFARYSLGVLVYNVAVIVWGAFVRATGSGAGCGDHWPTCNGQVVPRAPTVQTLIEFAHRATSGVDLVLVVALAVWAFRAFPKGHLARRGAALSAFFLVTESLLGAGLVLLRLVAQNQSIARAWYLALHLSNTFLLLAALTLNVWWAYGGGPVRPRRAPVVAGALGLGAAGLLFVTVAGGITALGDTLFPATSLAQGIAQDFSPTAHAFLQLRVVHPLAAMVTGLYVIATAWALASLRRSAPHWRLAGALTALVLGQVVLGFVNVALLAPVAIQLLHLALADALWVAFVLFAASLLSTPRHDPARG